MPGAQPRVAVIGAGPSGLYAAADLVSSGHPGGIDVDVIDRLPAPYGLVRYGVAPDHVKMKSVIRVLQQPFEPAHAHFLGNVAVARPSQDGPHISLAELRRYYTAIVHATGSSVDRRLGIEGEDAPGSYGSGAFVSWYCGHPDFGHLDPKLDRSGVAVIGAGNVALDVARVLARTAEEMADTDVPDHVLDVLRTSRVTDVHVLIRRAPEHVRFTPAELRQIGELANADIIVHAEDFSHSDTDRRLGQMLTMLTDWAGREATGRARRVHLWFQRIPRRILTDGGRVSGIEVERTVLDGDGRLRPSGETETLAVGLVVRAIGYSAEPVDGLPFDADTGTVPNHSGRVLNDGHPVPGAYVAGWIKRGPTGVIGTNKADAAETVAAVLEDLAGLPTPPQPDRDALLTRLGELGIDPVDWDGWRRLDGEELRRGTDRGTNRVKVAQLDDMLLAARGEQASTGSAS